MLVRLARSNRASASSSRFSEPSAVAVLCRSRHQARLGGRVGERQRAQPQLRHRVVTARVQAPLDREPEGLHRAVRIGAVLAVVGDRAEPRADRPLPLQLVGPGVVLLRAEGLVRYGLLAGHDGQQFGADPPPQHRQELAVGGVGLVDVLHDERPRPGLGQVLADELGEPVGQAERAAGRVDQDPFRPGQVIGHRLASGGDQPMQVGRHGPQLYVIAGDQLRPGDGRQGRGDRATGGVRPAQAPVRVHGR